MVHGFPTYHTPSGDLIDFGSWPTEVVAFLLALDALLEPADVAPLPRGTQDSVYDAANIVSVAP